MKIIQSAHPPELLQHTSQAPNAAIPSSVHQPKPPSSPIWVPARSKNALFQTSNKWPLSNRKLDAIPNKRKTKLGNAAIAPTATLEAERTARDATKRRLMKYISKQNKESNVNQIT